MTQHLYDDQDPDYLAEARELCESYITYLQKLPAYVYNARIEEFQAELSAREAAVDAALERKEREQIEAAKERNQAPIDDHDECTCDPRNPDAPACSHCRAQETQIPY
jgi:hypothetical protein